MVCTYLTHTSVGSGKLCFYCAISSFLKILPIMLSCFPIMLLISRCARCIINSFGIHVHVGKLPSHNRYLPWHYLTAEQSQNTNRLLQQSKRHDLHNCVQMWTMNFNYYGQQILLFWLQQLPAEENSNLKIIQGRNWTWWWVQCWIAWEPCLQCLRPYWQLRTWCRVLFGWTTLMLTTLRFSLHYHCLV